jgi:hypothetical protein
MSISRSLVGRLGGACPILASKFEADPTFEVVASLLFLVSLSLLIS